MQVGVVSGSEAGIPGATDNSSQVYLPQQHMQLKEPDLACSVEPEDVWPMYPRLNSLLLIGALVHDSQVSGRIARIVCCLGADLLPLVWVDRPTSASADSTYHILSCLVSGKADIIHALDLEADVLHQCMIHTASCSQRKCMLSCKHGKPANDSSFCDSCTVWWCSLEASQVLLLVQRADFILSRLHVESMTWPARELTCTTTNRLVVTAKGFSSGCMSSV